MAKLTNVELREKIIKGVVENEILFKTRQKNIFKNSDDDNELFANNIVGVDIIDKTANKNEVLNYLLATLGSAEKNNEQIAYTYYLQLEKNEALKELKKEKGLVSKELTFTTSLYNELCDEIRKVYSDEQATNIIDYLKRMVFTGYLKQLYNNSKKFYFYCVACVMNSEIQDKPYQWIIKRYLKDLDGSTVEDYGYTKVLYTKNAVLSTLDIVENNEAGLLQDFKNISAKTSELSNKSGYTFNEWKAKRMEQMQEFQNSCKENIDRLRSFYQVF